jgi:hypothetical protein
MNNTFTAHLTLLGVQFQIQTDYPPYARYLKLHFGALLEVKNTAADISVNASWNKETVSNHFAGYDKVGGSIYQSKESLIWLKKLGSRRLELHLQLNQNQKKLTVNGIYHKKSPKDDLKYLFGKNEQSLFFDLTYYYIYFPLFWYLEAFSGIHPLHASSLFINGKCIVLSGLEGIGKTTLALGLLSKPEAQLMSDNLIGYDAQGVRGCPEPIRLHEDGRKLVSHIAMTPMNDFKADKGFYQLETIITQSAQPVLVILPRFSEQTSLESITASRCADVLLNTNELTGELGKYDEFFSLLNLIDPIAGLREKRRKDLETLLSSADCYFLKMNRKDLLEQTLGLIWKAFEKKK